MKAHITGTIIVSDHLPAESKVEWLAGKKIDMDLDVDIPEIFTEASMRLDRAIAAWLEGAELIARRGER